MKLKGFHKEVHSDTLGSIINKDGDTEKDDALKIKVGWLKWRLTSGVLCDLRMPTRLKENFYRTAIRPAITCGVECWSIKKQHMYKMSVVEMRMLRLMCRKLGRIKLEMSAFESI